MFSLPGHGLSEEAIFEQLKALRSRDLPWKDGKLWAYVYPPPEHVARIQKRAFLESLTENGLDPTAFPSLTQMENQVLGFCREHLGGDEHVVGSFTTGGTESCLMAVKTARDHARKQRGIAEPELVVPVTAHAAFFKAAHYFDMKLVTIPVNPRTFKAEVADYERVLCPNTALLVASAPSYAHGVIDPITDIGALAADRDLLLHVDGCIGAFLLPWFRRLGEEVPAFDFSVRGVTSMSMDLHKYGFCPKGASVVLHRNDALRKHQYFTCASWTGYTMVNPTMLSSKSGGPVAAAWATLRAFGEQGYLDTAKTLLDARKRIVAGIQGIDGLKLLGVPELTLIAFSSDEVSIFHVADEMATRGFPLQVQLRLDDSQESCHLSLVPQALEHAEAFLAALNESVNSARGLTFGPLVQQVGAIPFAAMEPSDEVLANLLGAAGIDPTAMPSRMADINQTLNLMPPSWREKVLGFFVGGIFTPKA